MNWKTKLYLGCFAILLAGCIDAVPPDDNAVAESTRAANVEVLETLTFGGAIRRIWVYLPPDYAESSVAYPVLYLHDGQNVFDASTSYVGEWGVDELLNQAASAGKAVPIVVAVDHGNEARMQELSPWTNPEFGDAKGLHYAEFIVSKVKPYINERYRTLETPEHTGILGSSMGGLMSHYMITEYPQHFGFAGVFSPSFWYSEQAFKHATEQPLPLTHKVFFIVGEKEGPQMVDGMKQMVALYREREFPAQHLYSAVVEGADHNEAFWHSQFMRAIDFFNLDN